jgi:hypothetical protein
VAKELEQKTNNLKSEAEAVPIWDYSRILVHYSAITPSLLGANGQNRTDDPRFTKALLYRLSYVGTKALGNNRNPTKPNLSAMLVLIAEPANRCKRKRRFAEK